MPLESHREALDRLDAEIVRLLDERAVIGRQIGEIKRKQKLPLHHPDREKEILRRIGQLSNGSFPAKGLERIYREIMAETLALQATAENGGAACPGHSGAGKQDARAAILENVTAAPGYNRMRLLAPELAGAFRPGQFFQLRLGGAESGFFLRRPFAPSKYHDDGFSFYYAIVGAGTERLALMEPREEVDVLAPLGNAFTLTEPGEKAVLFGGGYGAPSLATLAAELYRRGADVTTLLGAKTVDALLNREGFSEFGKLVVATDDGSFGVHGTVIDAFRQEFAGDRLERTRFYGCGPVGMLRAVWETAKELGIRCEVSLEERMACGFGACMGCAAPVLTEGGSVFRRVCHEGPVFEAGTLAWNEMKGLPTS